MGDFVANARAYREYQEALIREDQAQRRVRAARAALEAEGTREAWDALEEAERALQAATEEARDASYPGLYGVSKEQATARMVLYDPVTKRPLEPLGTSARLRKRPGRG